METGFELGIKLPYSADRGRTSAPNRVSSRVASGGFGRWIDCHRGVDGPTWICADQAILNSSRKLN